MKRMGMVMLVTIFVIGNLLAAEETVESGTAVQTVGNGASTKVFLALTESKATLWFTERSAGTSAGSNLSEYALALLPNSDLPMRSRLYTMKLMTSLLVALILLSPRIKKKRL